MKILTTILLLLLVPMLSWGQYPIVEEFDSFGGGGEWTVDNGGGVQSYGGENYATFNIDATPYLNSTTHTILSPIQDFSNCGGDISISFPINGYVQSLNDVMNFEYYDSGGWVTDLSVTGVVNGTYTNTAVPNTTTQFRFQLITDAGSPGFAHKALNGNWSATYSLPNYFDTMDVSTQFIGKVRGSASNVITPYYYDMASFTIDCALPLPIELIVFDCNTSDDDIKLFWSTSSQINNDYFTVEHSTDSYNWEIFSRVDGAGNSNIINDYSVTHANASDGTNYYRLTQVDFNGKSETFNIVSCTRETDNKEVVYVKYYNNLGQEINKPLEGYYIEVITYIDKTSRVDKHFTIKN